MIRYQKTLRSKDLDNYKSFLSRLKSLGDDFLIKGDMWAPSIRTSANSPGKHVSRDSILSEYYNSTDQPVYLKFTCSHLSDTYKCIMDLKGRKHTIQIIISDDEIVLRINDDEFVVASKYNPQTVDYFPDYKYFDDVINVSNEWHNISDSILLALIDGHPVTFTGNITGTQERTRVRFTGRFMKTGSRGKSLNYTSAYTLMNETGDMYDETICQFLIHTKYPVIESIDWYHIRKYLIE